MSKEKLSSEEIREELKRAYQLGVANGENRSEKNFNDYLQTSHAKGFLEAIEHFREDLHLTCEMLRDSDERVLQLQREREEIELAANNLLFLHSCEEEGISSGMPTAKQWRETVEALRNILTHKPGKQ